MSLSSNQTTAHLPSQKRGRFISLRAKFVLLFSMILIVACSSLSWYFIETRRAAMTEHLEELGTILLTNTVRNQHFRTAGLVLEDRITLDQFMQSLMSIEHVIYVMIETTDGRIHDRQSKRSHMISSSSMPMNDALLYPRDDLSTLLHKTPPTVPTITKLILSNTQTLVPLEEASDWLLPFLIRDETVYDFALPVLRESSAELPLSRLTREFEEPQSPIEPRTASLTLGLVRIGITDLQAKHTLLGIIRHVTLFTLLMIATGIIGAYLFASQITTPLRSLAGMAQRLTKGNDEPVPLPSSTHDEVGQLTDFFNEMTQSLYERSQAIASNVNTIKRQVRQLTTVHQASAAIARTSLLDLDRLLETVLRLLSENLGFPRITVMLYHADRNCTSFAKIIGVTPEVEAAAQHLTIPVVEGSITADLLIHGKPLLIHDIESVAHRFYPPALELMRRSGTRSIVCVPLRSHARILGYLVCSRGSLQCNEEDLDTLTTIAGHVAAAIDNAKTYADLAELTQHLEERIDQRTQELSQANLQLQEHDRRRSTFLSVVSHELRTPMTAIRSFAENMLDGVTGPVTPMQQTYLSRIQHNVARLGRIIVQLLDWSRLDTKKVELQREPVCIHQIATTAADSLQVVAADKDVRLDISAVTSLPLVSGDRDKLEQILWNLIGNAIKFTSPGGLVTVDFCATPTGFVQTCVTDTGCGIDTAHLPHVFNEFSRVPSAIPTSQGAQLGLCITKTLVTMHQGHIWVESQPQIGSRFYFTLPIADSLTNSRVATPTTHSRVTQSQ